MNFSNKRTKEEENFPNIMTKEDTKELYNDHPYTSLESLISILLCLLYHILFHIAIPLSLSLISVCISKKKYRY